MFGYFGHGKIRIDDDAAGAVGLRVEPFSGGRGAHAGRPDDRAALDPLVAEHDAGRVAGGDGLVQDDLGAHPFERASRIIGECRVEDGKNARTRLDKDDSRVARIDVAEIGRESTLGKLGYRAGHLHAGRAAADHDEGQEPSALRLVRFGLGALEGDQDAPAKLRRVLDLLQARSGGLPFVMAEIGVASAGREDEMVVGDRAAIGHHLLCNWIDADDLRQHDAAVFRVPQDAADRRGDIGGRERRGRHLVEQRLKEVVVAPVDDGHTQRSARKPLGGGKAAEPCAHDDDAREPGLHVRNRHLILHLARGGPSFRLSPTKGNIVCLLA